MLTCTFAYAEVNEKHSYRDYVQQDMTRTDPREWNDTTIKGTCFYREAVWHDDRLGLTPPEILMKYLPDGVRNVVIDKGCNYDNGAAQSGVTIDRDAANRRIAEQADWEDWICDEDNKPIEPMRKETFIRAGRSIDPRDIPNTFWTKEERKEFTDAIREADMLTP